MGGKAAPCEASRKEAHLPGDLSDVPSLTREPVLEAQGEDETWQAAGCSQLSPMPNHGQNAFVSVILSGPGPALW